MSSNGRICGQPDEFAFSADNLAEAERIFARYPKSFRSSALMPLLSLAQDQIGGWLSKAAIDCVSDLCGVTRIQGYEVATFYSMYNLQPIGRHHVQVCTNISCWLKGSDQILDACRTFLGIDVGETTADGLFTLSEVECLGACVNAPMVQIDRDYYEDLDKSHMQGILTALQADQRPRPGPQNGRHSSEPVTGLTSLRPDGDGGAAAKTKAGGA